MTNKERLETTQKGGDEASLFGDSLQASRNRRRSAFDFFPSSSPSLFLLLSSSPLFTLFANTIPEAETILSIAYAAERALLVEPTAMVLGAGDSKRNSFQKKRDQKLDGRRFSS